MAGSNTRFLCQKLVYLIHAVSVYLRPLFSFISTFIFRLRGQNGSSSLNNNGDKINFVEAEAELLLPDDQSEKDTTGFRDFDDEKDESDEEEVYLKFNFQTYEEFSQIQKETGKNVFNSEVVPCASASKYEFASGKKIITAFIDDDKLEKTFSVKEINDSDRIGNSSHRNLEEVYDERGKQILAFDGVENEKIKSMEFTVNSEERVQVVEKEEEEEEGLRGNDEFIDENQFMSENKSVITDSDSESTSFEHMCSLMNRLVDSYSDGFLSDGDFGGENEMDIIDENDKMESESEFSDDFDDEEVDTMEEITKSEVHNGEKLDDVNSDFLREKDFNEDLGDINDAEFVTKYDNGGDDSEKLRSKDSLESLWEHQELIEQLQMELRKVRATGLPTILEESESPKMMDDLKPWKIDEFKRDDGIGELHKFYKSYRERMRKFDIVNYQKMYAMGFLQLKDPLQPISMQKPSPPTLKSLVSQNLWLSKHKIHGSDPMKKFILELQGDLEAVYVGQMCLSWEFLHWQYDKALDLWDSDPRCIRRYNEVAGEFQQFQVLMQRFIEDEPFQGPRVQNYVKTRCAVRNLLQVPVIREDNMKDKRKARKMDKDEYVITSDMLVEIVEESIRLFWRFVRADKDCTTALINGNKKMPDNLSSPEDTKLLLDVKKILQKKERKLKDLLRSENCILRKFRRCREDNDSDQVLYFFSQVDMKLVSRVLNMSKITRDQLLWCHNKLDRISFVNRKVRVEAAFMLFPS